MSREKIEQPKDLDDAFRILKDIMSSTSTSSFKDTLEENAMAMTHFGIGMYLRNNWYLWWHKDNLPKEDKPIEDYPMEKPEIVKYFNDKLAIFHADDMSGIIIQSFHRHLNGVPLNLEEQVKVYHKHWEDIAKENFTDEDNEKNSEEDK